MLKKYWRNTLMGFVAVAIVAALSAAVTTSVYDSQFRVIYSLDKRATDQEIIRLINDADKYAYFAIYYFTRNEIAEALIRAKDRGVLVWGIMDAGASRESNKKIIESLRGAGIPVEVQRHQDGIMHIKALVTEDAYASGSYNWTTSATESNDEVLEIGTNDSVRKKYLKIITNLIETNKGRNSDSNSKDHE